MILRVLRRLVWWVVERTFEQTLGSWLRKVPADAESGPATSTLPSSQVQPNIKSDTTLGRQVTPRQPDSDLPRLDKVLTHDTWRRIGAPRLAPGLGLFNPGEVSKPQVPGELRLLPELLSSQTAPSIRTSRVDNSSLELGICRRPLGNRQDLYFIKPPQPRSAMLAAQHVSPLLIRGDVPLSIRSDTQQIAILYVNDAVYRQDALTARHSYNPGDLFPGSSQRSTLRPLEELPCLCIASIYHSCIGTTSYTTTLRGHREQAVLAKQGSFTVWPISVYICAGETNSSIGDRLPELEHPEILKQGSSLGGWLRRIRTMFARS